MLHTWYYKGQTVNDGEHDLYFGGVKASKAYYKGNVIWEKVKGPQYGYVYKINSTTELTKTTAGVGIDPCYLVNYRTKTVSKYPASNGVGHWITNEFVAHFGSGTQNAISGTARYIYRNLDSEKTEYYTINANVDTGRSLYYWQAIGVHLHGYDSMTSAPSVKLYRLESNYAEYSEMKTEEAWFFNERHVTTPLSGSFHPVNYPLDMYISDSRTELTNKTVVRSIPIIIHTGSKTAIDATMVEAIAGDYGVRSGRYCDVDIWKGEASTPDANGDRILTVDAGSANTLFKSVMNVSGFSGLWTIGTQPKEEDSAYHVDFARKIMETQPYMPEISGLSAGQYIHLTYTPKN